MVNGNEHNPSESEKDKKGKPKCLIAGIGASAGGLESIQELFANLPDDTGIAFVVVTHQPSGRASLLPEILARSSRIPVIEAAEGMKVEPNKVYVAPSGSQLSIAERVLHLSALPGTLPHFPIDFFLRSLSFDQRENAIGVILSGTGSDGTLGVRSIKEAFGMVMVQDSTSARYIGMPSSANATGLADFVLTPSEMSQQLAGYANDLIIPRKVDLPVIAGEPLQQILLLLRDQKGVDFSTYKVNTINRRIKHRMNVLRISETGRYVLYLQENPAELSRLFEEMLISVTSFFRDPEAFEALIEKALPDLLKAHQDDEAFRAWVPGCATGEEAYSVAIALDESMEKLSRKLPVQIFATDLDARAIETARQAIYGEGIAADVSQGRLDRYFIREEGQYRIRREMREMIVFAPQNLIKDPPFTKMDLIVCRNLLIYLNTEMQRWVLQLFHHALKNGGILLLGSSETTGPAKDLFAPVDAKRKIYRRQQAVAETQLVTARPTGIPRVGVRDAAAAQPVADIHANLQAAQIQKFLLSQFAPCSVVVDPRGTIVYIHGRSGLYLEPPEGRPRNNVVDMAREGLKQALHGTLSRAPREYRNRAGSYPGQDQRGPLRSHSHGHPDPGAGIAAGPRACDDPPRAGAHGASPGRRRRKTGRSLGNARAGAPVHPGVAAIDH
jgi:two-component system, chemotaxis family, CheB/CheR fusion protein